MDDIIARIKHKLAYLQEYDDNDLPMYLARLSNQFNGQPRSLLSEEDVTTFEVEHQIRLPEDYRRFIMEVGTQGLILLFGFSPLGAYRSILSAPFPFNKTVIYEERDEFVKNNSEPGGYLPFIHTGCVCYYSLIITGEERGHVWHVDDSSLFAPVYLADGVPVHHWNGGEADLKTPPNALRLSFTEWYDACLDEQISLLQNYQREQGRDFPPLTLPAE